MDLLPATVALIVGFAGLVWGADRFISAAAGGAKTLGISPIIIGLTVVSIGTSAPEVIVSINAAILGAGELAVGNALGSNLANIGLVLGITALIAPLPAQRHLVFQEGPVLILITLLAGLCLYNASLDRPESIAMLLAIPLLLWVTVKHKKQHPDAEEIALVEEFSGMPARTAGIWFLVGLTVMLAASNALVWGARVVALELGMSELMVGLTIVAVGTSLPELAASVASALRGHHDIAIGNVFGSNVFNLLMVMPVAGAIAPVNLDPAVFSRDYFAVGIFTLLLVGVIGIKHWLTRKGTVYLTRQFGCVLLIAYIAYYVALLPGA
tara:strand:- start:8408 stop:9382 length:975 start_codon:yes stop_codon:yes gene_type:complete